MSAWELLDCDLPTGKRIAVIGGGAVGLETAHFLAAKGTISPETLHFLFSYNAEEPERLRELVTRGTKDITVFELQKKAGQGVGKSTKWVLFGDLDKLGVEVLTEVNISEIRDGVIQYTMDGKDMEREFDTIVYATGTVPNNTLQETLEKQNIPWKVIGDAGQPGTMDDAIHAGYLAALEIDAGENS
jgi:2,4-dienoyl-CoA reductase (NADPH2)